MRGARCILRVSCRGVCAYVFTCMCLLSSGAGWMDRWCDSACVARCVTPQWSVWVSVCVRCVARWPDAHAPLCTHSTPLRTLACGKVPACVPRTPAHPPHSRNSQTLRIIRAQMSTSAAPRPPCNGRTPPRSDRQIASLEVKREDAKGTKRTDQQQRGSQEGHPRSQEQPKGQIS